MTAIEKRAQNYRCTSVDDLSSSLQLLDVNDESIAIIKLTLEQCEYQGFQKTKVKMLRAWLKRAAKKEGK